MRAWISSLEATSAMMVVELLLIVTFLARPSCSIGASSTFWAKSLAKNSAPTAIQPIKLAQAMTTSADY
jgi:hypothetical protein